jgi:uncharacterized protein
MKTPCVNVCQMDPRRGICLGCKRTLDEIARWAGMSDVERERVLAELPRRALDVPEVPVPPLA